MKGVLQAMGLASVAFLGRLLPLLVDWTAALDKSTRVAALETLHLLISNTWPRLGQHAALLLAHVQACKPEDPGSEEFELRNRVESALTAAQEAAENLKGARKGPQ